MTPSSERILDRLATGTIEIVGQIAWSSNAIFLVDVVDPGPDRAANTEIDRGAGDPAHARADAPGEPLQAIYKPVRGERPLHDFPEGIARREVAAHRYAQHLGWDLVPETVWVTGPLGEGSLQRFVDVDYDEHYFTLVADADPHVDAQLRRICCFDLLINNTDRKSGHCIVDADRHVWAIDNALTFHAHPKVRTVIWDYAGEPIEASLLDAVAASLEGPLPQDLVDLLDPDEYDALRARERAVLAQGVFPHDPTGRAVPWPLV